MRAHGCRVCFQQKKPLAIGRDVVLGVRRPEVVAPLEDLSGRVGLLYDVPLVLSLSLSSLNPRPSFQISPDDFCRQLVAQSIPVPIR